MAAALNKDEIKQYVIPKGIQKEVLSFVTAITNLKQQLN